MLTDVQTKRAKPSASHYKLPDERGLHLLVKSNGSKLWQLRYRYQGKEKTASLGQYPDVSLAEAREKREALRKLIAKGVDPVLAKQADKEAQRVANLSTFEVVARQWYSKQFSLFTPVCWERQMADELFGGKLGWVLTLGYPLNDVWSQHGHQQQPRDVVHSDFLLFSNHGQAICITISETFKPNVTSRNQREQLQVWFANLVFWSIND